ncbi:MULTISPECIES: DnaJ C-terminal domain-containing protein [unclassified Rhizobium]|uniref:DnaJ C-terminal domain-containing protein n=1 Tax=unclassified Rhizobium TaxID=2613769 RepID=UPI001607BD96|nr:MULTISPECIES: DnaJ C-terminal domain-containing protein [unclassified Rhizobium]MBB3320245.1 DnaJ-class molecular chaperone [Rhizobium sp. BK181]MBB3544751.1 DnaJ-class molecular chaperone [Rhizobium sp. BK399]MCS3743348.1 DnaJ-class molecular chaperone [Rhizobium sp. BK661]MCS4095873.1 DnaJ-class molecular chaperone [Rhizobium sp. BK176]
MPTSSSDPYDIIGVRRDASQNDIQAAYRRRAKKLHPDLNPGNKQAEQDFKNLSAAYEILRDEEKRRRFDNGEIDATGAEKPQRRYYRDFADAGAGDFSYENGKGFADPGEADIFAEFFSRRGRRNFRMPGADLRYSMEIDFIEAINGGTRQVTLSDGQTLEIRIPPGARDGQILRLRGKGGAGEGGAETGDALIELHVRPHPFFRREGDDIRLDLPITLGEAVLGGKVTVPTPAGPVLAIVPENSSSGKTLRVKGKGAARRNGTRGDVYATLKIVLPERPDTELKAFVAGWSASKGYNPRQGMGE